MSNAVIRPLQPETPIFREAPHKRVNADHFVDSALSLADMRIEIDKLIESLKSRGKAAAHQG